MNFTKKTVLITGASSGIGQALAYEFALNGANLILAARSIEQLSIIALDIKNKYNVGVVYQQCDVTQEMQCKDIVEKGVEEFGGIDIVICNAGISMRALFVDVDLSVIKRLMDVNFWGAVYCIKYSLPYVIKAKGSIVGVSSVAGFHGLPARTGYSASKYAMTGLLDTIRVETLRQGVHVMIAAPGFTASNVRLSALTADGSTQGASPREEGKMMTAQEAAHRIVVGVYKRKREVVMDFQGRATKFIKKFAPGLLDKLFYNHMAKEEDSPLKK